MLQEIYIESFVFITLLYGFYLLIDTEIYDIFLRKNVLGELRGLGIKYWNGKGCCFHFKKWNVLPCTLGFQIAKFVVRGHNLCVTDWLESLLIYMERWEFVTVHNQRDQSDIVIDLFFA